MAELRKLTTKWTLDVQEYIQGAEKTITKTKQISASTEEGQKALQRHIGELKGTTKITADQFNVMSAEVKKAEREAKKADKAFNDLNRELMQEQKMLTMTAQEQRIFNAELRLGAGATEAQKREIRELIIANDAMAKSSGKLSGSMRMQRNGFSQMQYQLQDIAVQMQMGTNPFTILGQQGPQIAALFGPAGAVAGSIIAFGAMFGGVALSSLLDFESATDKLKKSQEDLAQVLSVTSGEGAVLTESFSNLVETYNFLADEVKELAINRQLKVAKDSVKVLQDAYKEAVTEFGVIDSSGVDELNAGILAGAKVSRETKLNFEELKSVLDSLGEEGANFDNVLNLTMAIDNLIPDDASEEMLALKATLLEQLGVLRASVVAMSDLESSTKSLTEEEKKANQDKQNSLATVAELVDELEQEAITYGMTADAIVLYNAAQKGATNEQLDAIKRSQEIIRIKKAEEKAWKDARKAEEEELKDKEKRQKNYDKLMDKAFKDQLKRYDEEENAKRALEDMKINVSRQAFDNLASIAEEGSMLAKLAFLGQQAIAANEVIVNANATKAKYFDNPAMTSMIDGQMYASLATIAGTTIAGVFHGGGAVPGGDHEQTYLLKGGEYVESRAERREIDQLIAQNNSGEMKLNLTYNIQAWDNRDLNRVLMDNNKSVYGAVESFMRKQGRRL